MNKLKTGQKFRAFDRIHDVEARNGPMTTEYCEMDYISAVDVNGVGRVFHFTDWWIELVKD